MATISKVVLTEENPVAQTTERDKKSFVDGRLFQINVASLDGNGDVIANVGELKGKWKGVGAGIWDDFENNYNLSGLYDGKTVGGWNQNALGAEYFEFDAGNNVPAGGSIEITIRDWNQ
tara:strand:+ start:10584 stop:10940 length:357 start_codon:yes stop_codon:yes gene_type:complete